MFNLFVKRCNIAHHQFGTCISLECAACCCYAMSRSSAKGVDAAAAQAAVQGSTRSQVPAAHPQGQGVESDEWAFVSLDGRSRRQ